ncbi:MAG: PrsW family intramembrane metalloprotease [Treponema sp.]|jgi:RsiW-degrading membrane proteinase PrsW (M82 family)|nr:PrsW family intramembrane metalloprotease [Treponema sp.]
MNALFLMLILILIAALPLLAAWLVIRHFRVAMPPLLFAGCLLSGIVSLFIAVLFQSLFPSGIGGVQPDRLRGILLRFFFRIAFTEELSRLLALLAFFALIKKFRFPVLPPSLVGLLSGLGFAVLEAATYGAADIRIALLRAFTAAPLHGACAARTGSAAASFREDPPRAFFRFLSAVVIHGMYNFIIIIPGPPALIGILIVFSALASSLISIRSGLQDGDA